MAAPNTERLERMRQERPRLWRLARASFRLAQRGTVPLRRRYYVDRSANGMVQALPAPVRSVLGLDDPSAVGSRKIEIGGGPHALEGYIHVDVDPAAHHLEFRTSGERLPFPDGWAEEIVAIHALEHVPPPRLVPTLAEWLRVLQPGGRVRVHVPNAPELFDAFVRAPVDAKWPVLGSLLGMYVDPDTRRPEAIGLRCDHQLIFDWPLLEWALREAGFESVRDLTEEVTDRHTTGWRDVVPHYSLIAEGVKPGPAGG